MIHCDHCFQYDWIFRLLLVVSVCLVSDWVSLLVARVQLVRVCTGLVLSGLLKYVSGFLRVVGLDSNIVRISPVLVVSSWGRCDLLQPPENIHIQKEEEEEESEVSWLPTVWRLKAAVGSSHSVHSICSSSSRGLQRSKKLYLNQKGSETLLPNSRMHQYIKNRPGPTQQQVWKLNGQMNLLCLPRYCSSLDRCCCWSGSDSNTKRTCWVLQRCRF